MSADFIMLLIMAWRQTTHPMLPTYLDRRPFNRPDVGIACPDGLTLALAQQSLIPVLDTRADGNCGLHGFIISLVDKVALSVQLILNRAIGRAQ